MSKMCKVMLQKTHQTWKYMSAMEKIPKLMNIGLMFIPDYRVLDEGIPKIWEKLNSHNENSISSIFLESPQVDIKNVVKSSKHFFGYFNTIETHSTM